MENIQQPNWERRFWAKTAAAALGLLAIVHTCVPEPREPSKEQRQNPQFIECVDSRLAHDEFNPATTPQGIYFGPSAKEIAEERCMDDIPPR